MRVVIQRVLRASVTVVDGLTAGGAPTDMTDATEGKAHETEVGRIGPGLMVLIGVAPDDTLETATRMAARIAGLRIFSDDNGRMNRDVRDGGGAVLAISQFTLLADTRRGRRPSFMGAAPPAQGEEIYEAVVARLHDLGLTVRTGRFGAHMRVDLVNDGPVTIILDEWLVVSG